MKEVEKVFAFVKAEVQQCRGNFCEKEKKKKQESK